MQGKAMGDYYQTIVDRDVRLEEAADLAGGIVHWLVAREVIEAAARDCTLGKTGHPPGPHYLDVVDLPSGCRDMTRELVTNGLEVEVGRRVFYASQAGSVLVCPKCEVRLEQWGDAWGRATTEWYKGTSDGTFCCPQCGHCESVTEWRYEPPWGFGNLGFTFWNWPPMKPSFVAELTERLGHRTVVVRGKI